ncbi:elongation of very long chain fatty acids protein [Coccinella septempunctata]|uniref:elongation of very long chain fatty acids protein n=1 Tax=Coccinella septempunctata TaxID=41139 RepID=UPI001D05F861|nr:elongation of very long chain fatty acids protein [Coccinella septempunctata]
MKMNASSVNSSGLYHYVFEELADPRVKDWLLMKNPSGILTITAAYLYFIFILGPRYMKNKEPFNLKYVLIVYNFLQMLLSIYITVETLDNSWLKNYSLRCQPVDYSWTPDALRVARGVHIYHLAKVTELLDTVFFVLRKKTAQITFLHIYHHTMMGVVTWAITKYVAGGQITFNAVVNSFVHIIMYFYYMVSACGPRYQKYLWWKKYITTLQLAQFVVCFFHSLQILFYDCGYPRSMLFLTIPNCILFYSLFSDFYSKAYRKNSKKRTLDGNAESSIKVNGFKTN